MIWIVSTAFVTHVFMYFMYSSWYEMITDGLRHDIDMLRDQLDTMQDIAERRLTACKSLELQKTALQMKIDEFVDGEGEDWV